MIAKAKFTVIEAAAFVGDRVDTEAGVIRDVKVLGYQSKNLGRTLGLTYEQVGEAVNKPYSYARAAVEQAMPLYEGVGVYVDHPTLSYKPGGERVISSGDRKTIEQFGRLVNVRVTETGMFADLEYLKSHPLAKLVAEAAQRMPEQLALSHNAKGDPQLVSGELVFTEIFDVRSVDLVVEKPGTNSSLFESEASTMDGETYVDPLFAPDNSADNAALAEQSIESMILAVLKDKTIDATAKVAKISKLVKLEEEILSVVTGTEEPVVKPTEAPAAPEAPAKPAEAPASTEAGTATADADAAAAKEEEEKKKKLAAAESLAPLVLALDAKLTKLTNVVEAVVNTNTEDKNHTQAKLLLESKGRKSTPIRIEAVINSRPETRVDLVETWNRDFHPHPTPRTGTAQNVVESSSRQADSAQDDSLAESIKQLRSSVA